MIINLTLVNYNMGKFEYCYGAELSTAQWILLAAYSFQFLLNTEAIKIENL